MKRFFIVGGSDAGISAALKARELDFSMPSHGCRGRRVPKFQYLRYPVLPK